MCVCVAVEVVQLVVEMLVSVANEVVEHDDEVVVTTFEVVGPFA